MDYSRSSLARQLRLRFLVSPSEPTWPLLYWESDSKSDELIESLFERDHGRGAVDEGRSLQGRELHGNFHKSSWGPTALLSVLVPLMSLALRPISHAVLRVFLLCPPPILLVFFLHSAWSSTCPIEHWVPDQTLSSKPQSSGHDEFQAPGKAAYLAQRSFHLCTKSALPVASQPLILNSACQDSMGDLSSGQELNIIVLIKD